jgi:ABC-2 type transport system permease protein
MYFAIARAGFRRYGTYRLALVAAMFANVVFGFLRSSVLLSVAGSGTGVGYSGPQLVTYVWAGQGLIGVVLIWMQPELPERISSGDIVTDLLRPVNPVWRMLAGDLGVAAYASLTRFVGPIVIGALFFDMYAPRELTTYPFFMISMALAVLVGFGCRFLISSVSYWLLDARGQWMAWSIASVLLSGLAFPLWFLPHPLALALYAGTPIPSVMQVPLDVLIERLPPGQGLALQATWVVVLLAACQLVQRRAERRLVVQGG